MTATLPTPVNRLATRSLFRLRLHGTWRSGRFLPPAIAAIVAIVSIFAGGASPAGDGWGLTAYVLMPVLAWQTKILLDTEPDVARRLAVVTVGWPREVRAGLAGAIAAGYALLLPALVIPWLIGGILLDPARSDPSVPPLPVGIVMGIWALVLMPIPALGLGALSSRVITVNQAYGTAALVGGWIVIVVAGLPRSPVRFLAPPLIQVAKAAHEQIDIPRLLTLTGWTLAWSAVVVAVYVVLRRSRA